MGCIITHDFEPLVGLCFAIPLEEDRGGLGFLGVRVLEGKRGEWG